MQTDFNRLIDLTSFAADLTVWVKADTDLDGTFEAICDLTGETLSINGWLFEVSDADTDTSYERHQRAMLDDILAGPDGQP